MGRCEFVENQPYIRVLQAVAHENKRAFIPPVLEMFEQTAPTLAVGHILIGREN